MNFYENKTDFSLRGVKGIVMPGEASSTYSFLSPPGKCGYIPCWCWLPLKRYSRSTTCTLSHQEESSSDIVLGNISSRAQPPACNTCYECAGSQSRRASSEAYGEEGETSLKRFSGFMCYISDEDNCVFSDLLGFILSTRPLFSTSTVSSSSSTTITGMMLRAPISCACFTVAGKPSSTYLEQKV